MESALVLSAYTAGLGVIRALGKKGVHVTVGYHDPWDMGRKSKYVREQFQLPDPKVQEQEYIDKLMQKTFEVDKVILMPASDTTLSTVSKHKAILSRKYIVACPDWAITETFLDKKNTSQVAERACVPAPKTFTPGSMEDIDRWGPVLMFPCLAKPSLGHLYRKYFNRKMTWVNNIAELATAYREAAAYGLEIMIQEFIPGEDSLGANYNAYFWEGKPLVEFTARKIRNAPPVMGSPAALISERIPEVIEQGRKLLGAVGFSGYACTEFKRDPRDDTYKLMEVNPRHNLSSLLAVRCGINFPWLQYQHLMHGFLPQPRYFETGIYWADFHRDLRAWGRQVLDRKLPLGDFLRPYIHRNASAIFDWSDPFPFIMRTGDILH